LSGLCILAAGRLIMLAATGFTLQWTHSVEKIEWLERWSVSPAGLTVTEAEVRGSGAGMEPPDRALRIPGGWRYSPNVKPLKQLVLASSGETVSAWTLCADAKCMPLGAEPGEPIVLWPGVAQGICTGPEPTLTELRPPAE
jgi:hypothetical protein